MPKRSPGSHSVDDINRRFGARLRLNRELAGRSQTEVGQALGVSFQQIQKYENGTTSISLNRLNDLAVFLRVSIQKLIDGLDGHALEGTAAGFAESEQSAYDGGSDMLPGPGPLSREKIALLTAFGHIRNQKVRRSVVSMVEALGVSPESDAPTGPAQESDEA